MKPFVRLAFVVCAAASLAACGNTLSRLSEMGQGPALTPIKNPAETNARVTMPAPPRAEGEGQNNASLWRTGARQFFKDNRANQVGDIVTVIVSIADTADFSNTTTRGRTNSEAADVSSQFLGYSTTDLLSRLPGRNNSTSSNNTTGNTVSLGGLSSTTSNNGTGRIQRSETLNLRVAAVVTQVLPNGNFVVNGSQEVRVNFEARVLQLAGVIRPQDITSVNTIRQDQLAEARIAYGGKGQITDFQQPRWGQQLFDIVSPF
ncbi:MAG: flagellar basal body L-ring protein FlgH [Telmatospirillum sp.]|nr:flagellar basal body L-ring protein FlgH [Telmatospirillum sp.]